MRGFKSVPPVFFFCSTCFFFLFFSVFFLFIFYYCVRGSQPRVTATHHKQQQHARVGRQSWKEAPMLEVSTMTGEGGSPVVTDPSAESGAGVAVAAAGGGGEDNSPVLGGVVGDGTAPT